MADAPGGRSLSQFVAIGEIPRAANAAHSLGCRGERFDRERVDIALQHVGERGVHQAVARHGGDAAERLGHDTHAKMALSADGPRMSGVQVTFVLDAELQRGKFGDEAPAQTLLAGRAAHGGSVPGRTGLVLLFSQNTWGIMKRSVAALIPITLKYTHTLSVKFRAT